MMLEAALLFHASGFSVIPVSLDGTKAPLGQWKKYQSERPSIEQLQSWFSNEHPGIGVVCGSVSGNLEMLEFEGRAMPEYFSKFNQTMMNAGLESLLSKLMSGYVEKSPSGGLHIYYRSTEKIKGNTKLAQRLADETELTEQERLNYEKTKRLPPPRVLIETRGEGGFVVVAPSHFKVYSDDDAWLSIVGGPDSVPELAADEINKLHEVCQSLDEYRAATGTTVASSGQPGDGSVHSGTTVGVSPTSAPLSDVSPGDDFNIRARWEDVLIPHGWTFAGWEGAAQKWTRPGKEVRDGHSALTGGNNGDMMYVFSTSTVLPDNEPMDKFGVYTRLNFNGDFARSTSDLRKKGYGSAIKKYRDSSDDKQDWLTLTAHAGESGGIVPPEIPITNQDDWFWESNVVLAHIREFARCRKAAPYSVLGHTLARVLAATPHQLVLPPYVGGYGTLNLFVAIVGRSGTGKGASRRSASDAINIIDPAFEIQIGSGEGIAATFVKPRPKRKPSPDDANSIILDDDGPLWIRHNALFRASEVGSLEAISDRGGSTLIAELNKMYSGEGLGFANRALETRLPVPDYQYRSCFTVDVQPGKARVLLANEDSGFLQRFMFVSTFDPGYRPGRPVKSPEPLTWRLPGELHPGKLGNPERIVIEVDNEIEDFIYANQDAVNMGNGGREGHFYQTQLKVATGIALLVGKIGVGVSDWELAAHLMKQTDLIIDSLKQHEKSKAAEANEAKAYAEAKRDEIKREAQDKGLVKKVSTRILKYLSDNPGGLYQRDLSRRFGTKDERSVLEDALIDLCRAGLVVPHETENRGQPTKRYALP